MRHLDIFIEKLILLCFLIFGTACSEEDDELYKLNYGTSFNMCSGYCKNEMTLESHFVTYNHTGWVDSIQTITCRDELEINSWKYFETHLNINDFFDLPKTIGCPDCADGGAEWIEIELDDGVKHKVTFEYGHEPDMLKDYIVKLREQMNKSVHCGEY